MWFTTADPAFLIKILFLSINLAFLLAAAGAPLLCLVGERLAGSRKKVFYDKFASHMCSMSLVLILCTLPLTAGSWLLLYFRPPQDPSLAFLPPCGSLPALLIQGLFLLSLLLLVLYKTTWKPLKKARGLHMFIGLLAFLAVLLCMAAFLAVQRSHFLYRDILASIESTAVLLEFLFALPLDKLLWPIMGAALLDSLCLAGALGLLFLILRRNRDDFGRDYYNFALRHACTWAVLPVLPLLALMGWLAYAVQIISVRDAFITLCCSGAFLLLATLLWLGVRRNETPLRKKPGMIMAAFLAILSVFGQIMCLAILYFSII